MKWTWTITFSDSPPGSGEVESRQVVAASIEAAIHEVKVIVGPNIEVISTTRGAVVFSSGELNLYLLTQNDQSGYDTYDSCIVAAVSAAEAQRIRPDGYAWVQCRDSSWARSPESVSVELIGKAEATKPGLILASYNAG